MSDRPKYVALCVDDDEVIDNYGEGGTVDEAYDAFMDDGLAEHCEYHQIKEGDPVEVYVYSTMSIDDSPWSKDELPKDITWCLDAKVDTRMAKAVIE